MSIIFSKFNENSGNFLEFLYIYNKINNKI